MFSYHFLKTYLALSEGRFQDDLLETQHHYFQPQPLQPYKGHVHTSSDIPFKREGFQDELLETQHHYIQPQPC
mgnify:FL=1